MTALPGKEKPLKKITITVTTVNYGGEKYLSVGKGLVLLISPEVPCLGPCRELRE